MKVSIDRDSELVRAAMEFTGIYDLKELAEKALRDLIQKEEAKRAKLPKSAGEEGGLGAA